MKDLAKVNTQWEPADGQRALLTVVGPGSDGEMKMIWTLAWLGIGNWVRIWENLFIRSRKLWLKKEVIKSIYYGLTWHQAVRAGRIVGLGINLAFYIQITAAPQ